MKSCVFDIDGTLIDFKHFDNLFVSNHFNNRRFVLFLDRILWKINSLDVITNTSILLKFRFFIYCLFSFKLKDYHDLINMYKTQYSIYLKQEFIKIKPLLESLKSMRYKIFLITNNNSSNKFSKEYLSFSCFVLYAHKFSRKHLYTIISKLSTIEYIVGNNYMDDILNAKAAKKINKNIKSVYVGTSPLKSFFKADFCIENIEKIKEIVT